MAAKDLETVLDVQSVVEAVVTDQDVDVPSYEVESLCMRCGENVLALFLHFNFSQILSYGHKIISVLRRIEQLNSKFDLRRPAI